MIEHMQRLFAYDDWANREILTSLQALEAALPRSVKFLAHILAAQRLWYERLQLQKQTYPVWPDFSLEHCNLDAEELPKALEGIPAIVDGGWSDPFAQLQEHKRRELQ